jgi:cell division septation protein DedD
VTAKTTAPEQSRKSGAGKYQVQLLAGRNADEVRSAWAKLKAKNADLLGPLSPTLAPTELSDRGTYYRLRAGPLESEAKARTLCDRLSGRGASCIIIRPGS